MAFEMSITINSKLENNGYLILFIANNYFNAYFIHTSVFLGRIAYKYDFKVCLKFNSTHFSVLKVYIN